MARLWEGRFERGPAADMAAFDRSFGFDKRLWREDIEGSRAHAAMLGRQGIIPQSDADALVAELARIEADIESGALALEGEHEDIHSYLEAELTRRLGEAGKKVHAGRSRNDQVALAFRMHAMRRLCEAIGGIKALIAAILARAREHAETLMPGYTHTQRAQPVSFGHHLLAWCEMLMRDSGRLSDALARMDEMPLGSGALAGTGLPLDRDAVRRELGFSRLTANSLDAVSDRDFVLEGMAALSILMIHLSRMAEELVLWSTMEFGFVELSEEYSTGSSIMPQKKNPDSAELVRGKAGRVIGDLVGLLVTMKALPLAYNKDMQEDKEGFFDAADTATACLGIMAGAIGGMKVRAEAMRRATDEGFLNATDLADYLVGKGMAFRDAHGVAAKAVRDCIASGKRLRDLSAAELSALSPLLGEEARSYIDMDACLRRRAVAGGPAPERVREGIARVEAFLRG
jgi:argininosuccinate lyase